MEGDFSMRSGLRDQRNTSRCCKQSRQRLALTLYLGLTLSGCGQAARTHSDQALPTDDHPEIAQTDFALLSSSCTLTAAGIAIAVNGGETAVVGLNAANGNISVNSTFVDGSPCEAAPTLAITVSAGIAGDHGIYLDLAAGLFSQSTSANAPKIRLDLGTGSNDTLTVHGSTGADHFYFGRGSALNVNLLNFNGGTNLGEDSFADVSIVGAEHLVVTGGAGNDIIDASGLFGTVAAYPLGISMFGGPDDDRLTGGAGDDTLSGDAGNDQLNGGKGSNTYAGGSLSDGADTITVTATAVDTVDYSQRFNPVSVVLNSSPVSGEASEHDAIPDGISVLIGGSGNDSLSAAGSLLNHVLRGGPGNDTLIGGNGNDTLEGGSGLLEIDGDDLFIGNNATVSYSARTQPITVTMNAAGNGGADANDGDPRATRHVQLARPASAGATISASTNTVTGLSNMNAGSVGHRLIIANSAAAHDNGSYLIASVPSPTSVVLVASDTAANLTWASDLGATWTFAEDAGPEKDEVRCRKLTGSATASNTITGDASDNWITGGSAADTLIGGAGRDTLRGLEGNDVLYGGAGDDTLVGGPNSDSLHGGDGNDLLEGDASSDSFECDGNNDATTFGSAAGNADFTVDYQPGVADFDTRVLPNDCEF